MIVRNLIRRPIAVTMCLIALVAIGCISFKYIPVSLMPDIDIPQITVQASWPGASAREVDGEVVNHPSDNRRFDHEGERRVPDIICFRP